MARHLILVVDDEDNLRDVLVEVLKRDGHEVDSAVDGTEGLRRAEERRYDPVRPARRMPRLGAPHLYRARRERYPDRPPPAPSIAPTPATTGSATCPPARRSPAPATPA